MTTDEPSALSAPSIDEIIKGGIRPFLAHAVRRFWPKLSDVQKEALGLDDAQLEFLVGLGIKEREKKMETLKPILQWVDPPTDVEAAERGYTISQRDTIRRCWSRLTMTQKSALGFVEMDLSCLIEDLIATPPLETKDFRKDWHEFAKRQLARSDEIKSDPDRPQPMGTSLWHRGYYRR